MENYTFDLERIFIGSLPLLFYVEIALRTTVLYIFTLVVIRFLGKRSAGELTAVDVVVIVALGSAVGDPMFYPEVPILHGMLVITLVVALQRAGLHWATQNRRVDMVLKGQPSLVVEDGLFHLEGLESANVSKREVFQMARRQGYRHLGEIRRMYIETDDNPSIFGFQPQAVRPGLPFEPPWDLVPPNFLSAGETGPDPALAACTTCGQTQQFEAGRRLPECPRCQGEHWLLLAPAEDDPT